MADTPTEVPAWGHELEHWMDIGVADGTPKWIKITELLNWNENSENTTYTPNWIDRKNKPTFTMGKTASIDWEKDAIIDGELDEFMLKNRNKVDVPVRLMDVLTWMGPDGAKMADIGDYLLTPNKPTASDGGQPVVLGATCNMSSDGVTEGTWDAATMTHTPGVGSGSG